MRQAVVAVAVFVVLSDGPFLFLDGANCVFGDDTLFKTPLKSGLAAALFCGFATF